METPSVEEKVDNPYFEPATHRASVAMGAGEGERESDAWKLETSATNNQGLLGLTWA